MFTLTLIINIAGHYMNDIPVLNTTLDKGVDANPRASDFTPGLASPSASPSVGHNATIFNFTVIYSDGDNDTPTMISITINDTTFPMIPANILDTNYTDGAIYYYSTNLTYGYYQFEINCSDGVYTQSTGWINGPEVNPFKAVPFPSFSNYIMTLGSSYTWFDAITNGTLLSLTDDGYTSRALPFAFTFYDQAFSTIYISANGYMSFYDTTPDYSNNIAFPSPVSTHRYMIAPYWDDLNPQEGGQIHVRSFGTSYVIQYTNIQRYGSPGIVGTFQVVINQDGSIIFNYDYIIYTAGGYTCGLNYGINTTYYNAYSGLTVTTDDFSILFTPTNGYIQPKLPANGTTSYTGLINFSWESLKFYQAVNYTWQLSNITDFSTILQQTTGILGTTGTTTKGIVVSQPTGAYYWRVRPTSGIFNGDWTIGFTLFLVLNDVAPVLSNAVVDPPSGNQLTMFNFSIDYSDSDNNAPVTIQFVINDTTYDMEKAIQSDENYIDGCTYFKILRLKPGSYEYYFQCFDDVFTSNTSLFTGFDVIEINYNAPMLVNPTLVPTLGYNKSTVFSFQVDYMDIDDNAPVEVNVTIGSTSYRMYQVNMTDNLYIDGCTFRLDIKLNATGMFDYYFTTRDYLFSNSSSVFSDLVVVPLPNLDENFDDHFLLNANLNSGGSEGLWSASAYISSAMIEYRRNNLMVHVRDTGASNYYVFSYFNCENSPTMPNEQNQYEISFEIEMVSGYAMPCSIIQNGQVKIDIVFYSGTIRYYDYNQNLVNSYCTYSNGVVYRVVVRCLSSHTFQISYTPVPGGTTTVTPILFNRYPFTGPIDTIRIGCGDTTAGEAWMDNYNVSWTINENSPSITSPMVTPPTGDQNSEFNFTAVYSDLDNNEPEVMFVLLNGTSYPMSKSHLGDGNYVDGVEYYYITRLLPGRYIYSFICSDGRYSATANGSILTVSMTNTAAPVLSSGDIFPSMGFVNATHFRFSVVYFDADNNAPISVNLTVNSSTYVMNKVDPLDLYYVDGCLYEFTTQLLQVGNFSYQFTASDGITTVLGSSTNISVNELPNVDEHFENYLEGSSVISNANWTRGALDNGNGNTISYNIIQTGDTMQLYMKDTSATGRLQIYYNLTDTPTFPGHYIISFDLYVPEDPGSSQILLWNVLQGSIAYIRVQFNLYTRAVTTYSVGLWRNIGTININSHNSIELHLVSSGLHYLAVNGIASPTYNNFGTFSTFAGSFYFETDYAQGNTHVFIDNINHTYYPNHNAPQLINGHFVPGTGDQQTPLNFTVNYSDVDNTAPAYVRVLINGTQFSMSQQDPGDTNYNDGCIYHFTTFLQPGNYSYQFTCSDGVYTNSTAIYSNLTVTMSNGNAPSLDLPSVAPLIGDHSTTFNFTVVYFDADNNFPIWVNITINGTSHNMIKVHPLDYNSVDGLLYTYTAALVNPGRYTYIITCSDGGYSNSTGAMEGPEVNPFLDMESSSLVLMVPGNGSLVIHGNVVFTWDSWNLPFGAINYTWQFSSVSDFSSVMISVPGVQEQVGSTTITVPLDVPSGSYYWRVVPSYSLYTGVPSDAFVVQVERSDIAPELVFPKVNPAGGHEFFLYNFSIIYYDLDNNQPSSIIVSINGTAHGMVKCNPADSNYLDGCSYQYLTYLSPGAYTYMFSCFDGRLSNSTALYSNLTITDVSWTPPYLLNPQVSPTYGSNLTSFNFTVLYKDVDNDLPSFINITINGTMFSMDAVDPSDTNATDGILYQYVTSLGYGLYRFKIDASDGTFSNSTGWIDLPDVLPFLNQTAFFDDFETGTLKWTKSQYWNLVTPPTSTLNPYHSPIYGMRFGYPGNDYYPPGVDENLISIPIDLTLYDTAYLEFYQWLHSKAQDPGADIYISPNNGSTWYPLLHLNGIIPAWQKRSINISAYCGNPEVKIRFRFRSYFITTSTEKGWVLDDIIVKGIRKAELLTPEDGSDRFNGNVDFSWYSLTDPSEMNYTWQFSGSVDFSSILSEITGIPNAPSTTTVTVDLDFPAGTYFWRVRPTYEGFASAWSSPARLNLIRSDAVPALTEGYVSPEIGSIFTIQNFSVLYTDLDNNSPEYVLVSINGTTYPMAKQNTSDSDFSDGCLYQYLTCLEIGNYTFSFSCSDGKFTNNTVGNSSLCIVEVFYEKPQLANPNVVPIIGDSLMEYNFSILYIDGDNNYPRAITVTINGSIHDMSPIDPTDLNAIDGITFSYMTRLVFGYHNVTFDCFDGAYSNSTALRELIEVNPFFGISGYPVVINEFTFGQTDDYIEFYNLGESINMTGWFVRTYYNNNPLATYTFPQNFILNHEQFVVLHEASGTDTNRDLYAGYIFNTNYNYMAIGLFDETGANIDWFQWNYFSGARPLDVAWIQDTTNSMNSIFVLRASDIDNDKASDWISQPSGSLGSRNIGQVGYVPYRSPFSLLDPVGGLAVYDGLVNFSWESLSLRECSVNYTLELSLEPGFSMITLSEISIPETMTITSASMFVSLPANETLVQYYWRVIPTWGPFSGNPSGIAIFWVEKNTAPTLLGANVTPSTGNQHDTYRFCVSYIDMENDGPAYVRVLINGTGFDLAKVDPFDTNYIDGCDYELNARLNPGIYQISFMCYDGRYSTTVENITLTVVKVNYYAPVLSDLRVDPTSGNNGTTLFTFFINYTDADNSDPVEISVTINGTTYTLNKMDPGDMNYTNGCMFSRSMIFSEAGTYQFWFNASDGIFAIGSSVFTLPVNEIVMLYFDGMVYNWSAYFDVFTAHSTGTETFTNAGNGLFNVYCNPDTYMRGNRIINGSSREIVEDFVNGSMSFFREGSHDWVRIPSIISIGMMIPISVHMVNDEIFTVTSETTFFAMGRLFKCWLLQSPEGSVAYYDKKTGLLVNGTFWFDYGMGPFYYTIQITGTNVPLSPNNNAPVLTNGSATPHEAQTDTPITFEVTYTDVDDSPPMYVDLVLNGTRFHMEKAYPSDLDFLDGCVFKLVMYLQPGFYEHYFECYDGQYHAAIGIYTYLHVLEPDSTSVPLLISPQVSPSSGYVDFTVFTFSVIYIDGDNDAPLYVQVTIDAETFSMYKLNSNDTNYMDGCIYVYSSTLVAGSHAYRFNCSDGINSTTIGPYVGPVVSGTRFHAPIKISSNAELDAFPDKTGNGSAGDPYIIKDYIIDAQKGGYSILINNTDRYLFIINCTLSNSGDGFGFSGIRIMNSYNVVVRNCTVFNNSYGIFVEHASFIHIEENLLFNNNYSAVFSEYTSFLNVSKNEITAWANTAINVLWSYHGVFAFNNISGNYAGIALHESEGNLVIGNNVSDNNWFAFMLSDSARNHITMNYVSNNLEGIYLMNASTNIIYKNAFVNNNRNGYADSESAGNSWDYEYNGNYWNDYLTQNPTATNNGYVWNLPYIVPDTAGLNVDNFPLVTPFVFQVLDLHPVADFMVNATMIGENQSVQFIFTGQEGDRPATFLWSFGDGVNSTETNPVHKYSSLQNFTVSLMVTDADGDNDTLVMVDLISVCNVVPTASFTCNQSTIHMNELVEFTFTGYTGDGACIFSWDFGDGQVNASRDPIHRYLSQGSFNVSLNVTDGNGDWDFILIANCITVVDCLPRASFETNTTGIFVNQSVAFTFNGDLGDAPAMFLWQFGDGFSSSDQNPVHEYIDHGRFTVNLTVTDADGDVSSIRIVDMITVMDLEVEVLFEANQTIANINDPIQFLFTGRSGDRPVTFLWDFGDGNGSSERDPIHEYTNSSTFTVSLTVIDADGDHDVLVLANYITIVDLLPTAVFNTNTTEIGVLYYVQFTYTGFQGDAPAKYFWSFGDGENSTVQNPVHQYVTQGLYSVTLTVTDFDGDLATITIPDCINVSDVLPIANFTANHTFVMTGQEIQFTFTGMQGDLPASFLWDFGDGTNSTSINPIHMYVSLGNYSVCLTVTDFDGDTSSKVITDCIIVSDITPNITIIATLTNVTLYESITFSLSGSLGNLPITIVWDFDDGYQSTSLEPVHSFNTSGTFNVSVVVTDWNGDVGVAGIIINVVDLLPSANFTASSTFINVTQSITFTFTGALGNTPSTFLWDYGDGTFGTGSNPTHQYLASGFYNVSVTVFDADGDSDTMTRVHFITVGDGSPPVITSRPTSLQFMEGEVAVSLSWIIQDSSGGGLYSIYSNGTLLVQDQAWSNSIALVIPVNTTNVGSFYYQLQYIDIYGIPGSPDTVIVVIDDYPQLTTSPGNQTISLEMVNNLELAWVIEDVIGGLGIYEIYVDGIRVKSGIWTSGTAVDLNPSWNIAGIYSVTLVYWNHDNTWTNSTTCMITVEQGGTILDDIIDFFIQNPVVILVIGVAIASICIIGAVSSKRKKQKVTKATLGKKSPSSGFADAVAKKNLLLSMPTLDLDGMEGREIEKDAPTTIKEARDPINIRQKEAPIDETSMPEKTQQEEMFFMCPSCQQYFKGFNSERLICPRCEVEIDPVFACPSCGNNFVLKADEIENVKVRKVSCPSCGKEVQI